MISTQAGEVTSASKLSALLTSSDNIKSAQNCSWEYVRQNKRRDTSWKLVLEVNPLMGKGTYSDTSSNIKLVHWPLMGGLLHLVQRAGDWAGPQTAQFPPCCTKCNSPPVNGQCNNNRIVLLYNGPLLCSSNVPVKGLRLTTIMVIQTYVIYTASMTSHFSKHPSWFTYHPFEEIDIFSSASRAFLLLPDFRPILPI